MALDSIDTLLTVLRRSQLLLPEQVDEIARELGPHYADPVELGEYLVRIDWLTPYQLQLLLEARWSELAIGPYQVLDRLGEGGLSEVLKAWDTTRGREVALKVLRPDLTGKDDAVRQFQREFEAITRLSHPNIIRTFDAGEQGGLHYFAMEYVEGMDLERFVAQAGPLPVEMACDFIRQAAQGLQHAHQLGLVHRDIKPANLFLLHPPAGAGAPSAKKGPDPVVKIIDWGLARCANPQEGSPAAGDGEAEKGALIGTADYISPEQARDARLADIRADLYSLGCSLYFLLTAQPPFPAPSLMQKILMHQEKEPPSLRAVRDDVPEELDALVRKLLAKNPAERYQIPLLIVTPLRRFCAVPAPVGVRPAAPQRPSSGSLLQSPKTTGRATPGTAINLPRPGTHPNLDRPGQNGR